MKKIITNSNFNLFRAVFIVNLNLNCPTNSNLVKMKDLSNVKRYYHKYGPEYSKFKTTNLFGCSGNRKKMAKIIDGKQIAADIRNELREEITAWIAQGKRAPKLTTILVGSDPASATYIRNKIAAAAEVGIQSDHRELPATVTQDELVGLINELNKDDSVDGILVQLPVPEHINERTICNTVCPDKDIDGFNELNVGRLVLDMKSLVACTPLGIRELIKRTGIETFGKNAVVAGRSKNVGLPIAMLLHSDERHGGGGMDATVTVCHRYTPLEDLKRFCLSADIVISATGVPGLITADMIKPGACVIDVGIIRIKDKDGNTKIVGDVDFENVKHVAGHITPVPGGVGPMTVAMLMKNTMTAAKNLASKRE